eukprot:scaffold14090_cov31-Tisochrysis_lutea.AAC.1
MRDNWVSLALNVAYIACVAFADGLSRGSRLSTQPVVEGRTGASECNSTLAHLGGALGSRVGRWAPKGSTRDAGWSECATSARFAERCSDGLFFYVSDFIYY